MKINTLVIGLGMVGMQYDMWLDPAKYIYTHVRAASEHTTFNLVGGVDPDPTKRNILESSYKCASYSIVEEALRELRPDLIVIASPTHTHADIIKIIVATCHPKAILCEKPLAYATTEASEIVDACKKLGILLYVNYFRRSDACLVHIKKCIERGEMGDRHKGFAWYTKGLYHNGSHIVNLLEFWLGKPVNSKLLQIERKWQG